MQSEGLHAVRYIGAGTLGNPRVLRALAGNSCLKIYPIVLKDAGLRVLPLEDIPSDFVRNDLREGWNEKRGIPFYGVTTVVPSVGEVTTASMVQFTPAEWEKASEMFEIWNYHDKDQNRELLRFIEKIVTTKDGKKITYVHETLPNQEALPLQRMPDGYQSEEGWKRFIAVMPHEVINLRRNIEGSSHGKEVEPI